MIRPGGFHPLGLIAAALLAPADAGAQSRSYPGAACNLYGPRHPCPPYLLYPPGQDLRLTIHTAAAEARQSDGEEPSAAPSIGTIRQLFVALRTCWRPPGPDAARPAMQLTVRLSFRRDGNIIGQPRFTYTSPEASAAERDRYRRAVLDSIAGCTPLPFVNGMGNAIAGRPIMIRYIDDRHRLAQGAKHG